MDGFSRIKYSAIKLHNLDIHVDSIRSCKYSQVFLMMGEDIARNL